MGGEGWDWCGERGSETSVKGEDHDSESTPTNSDDDSESTSLVTTNPNNSLSTKRRLRANLSASS